MEPHSNNNFINSADFHMEMQSNSASADLLWHNNNDPFDGVMLRELIGSICNSPPKLNGDSREGSSVSQQIPATAQNGRKRKSVSRGKAKDSKVVAEKKSKPPEAPKEYIHVRAKRGQATDTHSLAERVRREKISERMKFLQDLVPGCNKVTGKAVMLDEIINYVLSLQRQVEFLSMKLSTVNPRMDFSMEAQMLLLPKECLPHPSALAYGYLQPHQVPNSMNGFGEAPQVSGLWEDDLQSIFQMGFGPNQPHNFHGQMKIEL